MLVLCLLTVLGLGRAHTEPLCGSGDCPAGWRKVEGDCVFLFISDWEETTAREVCRGLKAEYFHSDLSLCQLPLSLRVSG